MNLQSWILLILILLLCSYIVYIRFIKNDAEGGAKIAQGIIHKKGSIKINFN